MHVILNGEPLEEVNCFKYLGSQVTADGMPRRRKIKGDKGQEVFI